MAFFSRHRSYAEKVMAARKRRKTLGQIVLVLLAMSLIHTFFLQSFRLESNSMLPALARGDRVLSFSLPVGAVTIFGKLPRMTDLRRGELVVVAPDRIPAENGWSYAWDSVARFFTFQRFSPLAARYGADVTSLGVYRVVGLPGDTLRRLGSLYEVKPLGAKDFTNEYALSGGKYLLSGVSPASGAAADGTDSSERSLGPGEYFVACDDRSLFSGSALWGPIGISRVVGRVVATCWPPAHFSFQ